MYTPKRVKIEIPEDISFKCRMNHRCKATITSDNIISAHHLLCKHGKEPTEIIYRYKCPFVMPDTSLMEERRGKLENESERLKKIDNFIKLHRKHTRTHRMDLPNKCDECQHERILSKKYSYMFKNIDSSDVVKIKFMKELKLLKAGSFCLQSDPCKHTIIYVRNDGEEIAFTSMYTNEFYELIKKLDLNENQYFHWCLSEYLKKLEK